MKLFGTALFLGFLAVVSFAFLPNVVQAQNKDIVGVIFYADWCPSCKVLDPKIEEARKQIKGVEFITFDMTDGQTRNKTIRLAKKEGLDPVLQKFGARTGFMVVFDRSTGKIVDVLNSSKRVDDIVFAFEDAQQS